MNNNEVERFRVVLSYARPTDDPRPWMFTAGSLVLAATFVVTFWVVETATSNLTVVKEDLLVTS
jgi:hypothetical protein